jgi:hypothetical protein
MSEAPGVTEYERLRDELDAELDAYRDGEEVDDALAGMDAYVATLEAENKRLREDAALMDWLLLVLAFDTIGGINIWDNVDGADCTEGEMWSRYLTACRAAIAAARDGER